VYRETAVSTHFLHAWADKCASGVTVTLKMELRVVDRSALLETLEKMLVACLGEVKLRQNLQSFLLELAIVSFLTH
jgi:hypothetical protein